MIRLEFGLIYLTNMELLTKIELKMDKAKNMKKINILYTRVSALDQRTDRQRLNEKDFDLVIEDKCSGAIPFFERPGGKEIMGYIEKGIVTKISAITIDRLGRDMLDILNTLSYLNKKLIPVYFINQGLVTINENGKENPISKLIISILATISEMERSQIRERQLEGVKLAKARGVYKGRVQGSKEDVQQFLSKPKNRKALDYLKRGLSLTEAGKLAGVHINTMTKIRKLGVVGN
ncbi:MAG: recombinase family protein [Candidatus Gastranaerophilales bacterium]|nr:recombinase family protein [Candidatus Gastranaerophilales bacterium]